jgi:hypothetical protein
MIETYNIDMVLTDKEYYRNHLYLGRLYEAWYVHRKFDDMIDDVIKTLARHILSKDVITYPSGYSYISVNDVVVKERYDIKKQYHHPIIFVLKRVSNDSKAYVLLRSIDGKTKEDLETEYIECVFNLNAFGDDMFGLRGILVEEMCHARDMYINPYKNDIFNDVNIGYTKIKNIENIFGISYENKQELKLMEYVMYLLSHTEFTAHMERFDKVLKDLSNKELYNFLKMQPKDMIRWTKAVSLTEYVAINHKEDMYLNIFKICEKNLGISIKHKNLKFLALFVS